MLNAATIAAIVAAVWAHPSGVAYLAKIDQIEAYANTCGNPCCVKQVTGWPGDDWRQYKPRRAPTPEEVEAERIRLGIIEPAHAEIVRIADQRVAAPRKSPERDELGVLLALLRNDLDVARAEYEAKRAIDAAMRQAIAAQVMLEREEHDMAYVMSQLLAPSDDEADMVMVIATLTC